MSGRTIVRAAAFVAVAALAWDIGSTLNDKYHQNWGLPVPAIVGIALVIGLIALLLAPFIIIAPYRWIREQIRKAEVSDLIAGVVGLVIGLIVAALLALPLSQLAFFELGRWAPSAAALICAWLGITIAVLRKNDFSRMLSAAFSGRAMRRAAREDHDAEEHDDHDEHEQHEQHNGARLRDRLTGRAGNRRASDRILVDTSAIIDGRIADISMTGFITGTLVVPRFVLEELQHIADSADSMRRQRGRRGLEILQRLQKDTTVPVEISDADADPTEVDAKLVKLARQWRCAIITNDFNLNRVAELQGVKVLNINELAHAVKPILLPGEEMTVKIMQEGKEPGQGVGYLDDGTMIVVENGKTYMQSTIEVTVTRVLQTVAGRMIFAHPKQTAPNVAAARRTGTA
ncbi:MAG TPA: PIN domain-containing protein [Ktedonobacterales bacterium]|nr:PIN domain-containing protein [Ktedonobacterales bacterium]